MEVGIWPATRSSFRSFLISRPRFLAKFHSSLFLSNFLLSFFALDISYFVFPPLLSHSLSIYSSVLRWRRRRRRRRNPNCSQKKKKQTEQSPSFGQKTKNTKNEERRTKNEGVNLLFDGRSNSWEETLNLHWRRRNPRFWRKIGRNLNVLPSKKKQKSYNIKKILQLFLSLYLSLPLHRCSSHFSTNEVRPLSLSFASFFCIWQTKHVSGCLV